MEQGIKLENIANDSLDYVEGYIEEEPLDIKVEKEDCYNSSAEKDVFEAEETSVGNFCWNLDYLKINTIKEETIEDSEMLQNSNEIDAIDSKVTLNSNFVVDTSTSDTYEEILPPNAGRMRSCRKLGYKKSKKSQKHGKLFSCSKCEYTAIKFAYLKVHEAIHSEERPYQCLKCDYTSKYSSNFSQHKKKYHSEGKRNLGIRKKKLRKRKKLFTTQKKEKSPLSVDDDVEREKCEYDFEETTDSSSDLKFSRTHKQISKCVEKGKCKSKSLSENLKESHNEYKIGSSDSDIRTLSPVEEYKIDNLSKPALVDEKLNQSKTCEYSTAKRASLVDHEFLHTGKKYYRCLKCNFSFKNRFSLYRHKKLCNMKNTKDKCFRCKLCNYSTNSSYSFKDHEFFHTGKRPYTCLKCNFSFKYRSNLGQHEKICTGNKNDARLRNKNKSKNTKRSSSDKSVLEFKNISSHNNIVRHDHNLRKSNQQKTFIDISDSDENVEEKLISYNKICDDIQEDEQILFDSSDVDDQEDKSITLEECLSSSDKGFLEKSGKFDITEEHGNIDFSEEAPSTKSAKIESSDSVTPHLKLMNPTADKLYKCYKCECSFVQECQLNCHLKDSCNGNGNHERKLNEENTYAVSVDKLLDEPKSYELSFNLLEDIKVTNKKRKKEGKVNATYNILRQNGNEGVESILDSGENSALQDLNYNGDEEEEKKKLEETLQKSHYDGDGNKFEKISNTSINLYSFMKELGETNKEVGKSFETNDFNNTGLLRCTACQYTTQKHTQMNFHQSLHTGSIPYVCLKCNYGTQNKMLYIRHKRRIKCFNNNKLEKNNEQIVESTSDDDSFSDEAESNVKVRPSNDLSSGRGRILRERTKQKRVQAIIDLDREEKVNLEENVIETDDKSSDNFAFHNIKNKRLSNNIDVDVNDTIFNTSENDCDKILGSKRKRSAQITKCKKHQTETIVESDNSKFFSENELRLRSKRRFSNRINKNKLPNVNEDNRNGNFPVSHKSDDDHLISSKQSYVSVDVGVETSPQNYKCESYKENTDGEKNNNLKRLDVDLDVNQLSEMNTDTELFKFFPADSDNSYGDEALIQIFFRKPEVLLEKLKLHFCLICDFVSQSSSKLEIHKSETHLRSKKFECSDCSYTSVTWQSLKAHRETHKKDLYEENISESELIRNERLEINDNRQSEEEFQADINERLEINDDSDNRQSGEESHADINERLESSDDNDNRHSEDDAEEIYSNLSSLKNMQINGNKDGNVPSNILCSVESDCQVVENDDEWNNVGNEDLSSFYENICKVINDKVKLIFSNVLGIDSNQKLLKENATESSANFSENDKNHLQSDWEGSKPVDKASYEYLSKAVEFYKETLNNCEEVERNSDDSNTITEGNAVKDCLNSLEKKENVSQEVLNKLLKYLERISTSDDDSFSDEVESNVKVRANNDLSSGHSRTLRERTNQKREQVKIDSDRDLYKGKVNLEENVIETDDYSCYNNKGKRFEKDKVVASQISLKEFSINLYSNSTEQREESNAGLDPKYEFPNISKIDTNLCKRNETTDSSSRLKIKNNLRKKLYRKSFFYYNSSPQRRKKHNRLEKDYTEHLVSSIADKDEVMIIDEIKTISANDCSKSFYRIASPREHNLHENYISYTGNSVRPSFENAGKISGGYVHSSLNTIFEEPSMVESVSEADKLSGIQTALQKYAVYAKNQANTSTYNCESGLMSYNAEELPAQHSNISLHNRNELVAYNSDSNAGIILVPSNFNINLSVLPSHLIYSNRESTESLSFPTVSQVTEDSSNFIRTVPEPSISQHPFSTDQNSRYSFSHRNDEFGLQDKIKIKGYDTPVDYAMRHLQESEQPIVRKVRNPKSQYSSQEFIHPQQKPYCEMMPSISKKHLKHSILNNIPLLDKTGQSSTSGGLYTKEGCSSQTLSNEIVSSDGPSIPRLKSEALFGDCKEKISLSPTVSLDFRCSKCNYVKNVIEQFSRYDFERHATGTRFKCDMCDYVTTHHYKT